jgi:hypothetical protein
MTNTGIRAQVRDALSDQVANLLYYDRKEDPDLPMGAIEAAVANGTLAVDDIVGWFRDSLILGITEGR